MVESTLPIDPFTPPMATPRSRHQVENFSVQALPSDEAFVMTFANERREEVQVELPTWLLPQLMRVLPQVEALLREKGAPGLMAYRVLAWQVAQVRGGEGVTACFRDERQVEAGFHLQLEDARMLHQQLGDAIRSASAEASNGRSDLN